LRLSLTYDGQIIRVSEALCPSDCLMSEVSFDVNFTLVIKAGA
jgi:hypothetical protein